MQGGHEIDGSRERERGWMRDDGEESNGGRGTWTARERDSNLKGKGKDRLLSSH